jgi:alkylation response protein AidB-like acyl-CoA dehydrogenase
MDLLPTPEQEAIASTVATLLADRLPMSRVRELHDDEVGIDAEVWATCAEQGWFGLGLPEAEGGVGYGLAEEALLFREIGRHLVPGPMLATVLAARVLTGDGRAAVLAGTERVALVERRADGRFDVYDPAGAPIGLLVEPTGATIVALVAGELTGVDCIDPGVRLATSTTLLDGDLAHVPAAADPIFLRGAVLAAAMAAGVAEACRDLSAEHARTRVQFGNPIGINQAIKHACTDMAVRCEAASSQVFMAALTVEAGAVDAAEQASAAKVVATDAAMRNARATIQVHGGMGFTWEHDAHLLLKRAHVLETILGDRRHHLAAMLGA